MKKLTFNIIGAGAMGHLWASFLCSRDFKTTLYSRKKQSSQKFVIESPIGNFEQQIDYKELSDWHNADITLICVKAHQLQALCKQLKQLSLPKHKVILIMNGMGLLEICDLYLPQMQTLHASTVYGAYLQGNKIVHTGNGSTILGNLDSNYAESDFSELVKQLDMVLPEVSWSQNHQQSMNLKLIINAIINPLTAISNKTNGALLNNRTLIPQADELLAELKVLLRSMLPEMSYEQIQLKIEEVAFNTRNNISSMLQDIKAGKETEINYINGYLVKIAENQGIVLPTHVRIIQQIKQIDISQSYTNN
jgi:2-dehydropantoate 2-reductase